MLCSSENVVVGAERCFRHPALGECRLTSPQMVSGSGTAPWKDAKSKKSQTPSASPRRLPQQKHAKRVKNNSLESVFGRGRRKAFHPSVAPFPSRPECVRPFSAFTTQHGAKIQNTSDPVALLSLFLSSHISANLARPPSTCLGFRRPSP